MKLRDRVRDPQTITSPDASGSAAALEAVRNEADRFLSAGDAAINRALGGDSEAFLRAGRQQGGQ